MPGGVAPKFGSEKVSRYTGVSQLQLRVSRYTVQLRFGGAVKIAAASTENRAILVYSEWTAIATFPNMSSPEEQLSSEKLVTNFLKKR